MLCSECKKNAAILFYNKIENGKETMGGLCYECAQKKGINALDVLNKQKEVMGQNPVNMNDMSKQFENIFKDLAENINFDDIQNMEGAITFGPSEDGMDEDEETPKISGAAIPLGSIFSSMFGAKDGQAQYSQDNNNSRKKVKVEKKKPKQSKKKKYLDNMKMK